MKKLFSSLAVALVLLLGTGAFTTPGAQAATVGPKTSAPHTIVGPKTPVPHTVVNVGGGTWNYDTANCGWNCKHAWSHYVHNSKYHSATTICGSNNVKVFANPTFWANADANCLWLNSSAAYWATY